MDLLSAVVQKKVSSGEIQQEEGGRPPRQQQAVTTTMCLCMCETLINFKTAPAVLVVLRLIVSSTTIISFCTLDPNF